MISDLAPKIIPPYSMQEYDKVILDIFAKNLVSIQDIETRIKNLSAQFLGKPYILGALGEGPQGNFDKNPLYRTDGFDCVTFVATVLALAHSKNLEEFRINITRINYRDGHVTYVNRNHFMEVDWNSNNQKLGYLQDITQDFVSETGDKIANTTKTVIDKRMWYQMKSSSAIKTFVNPLPEEIKILVAKLQNYADRVQNEKVEMYYIPLSVLFKADLTPNETIFDQIPSPSIIEIVRPNWDLKSLIGTHINISHVGFGFRDDRGLIFRDASTITNNVRDILLADYLKAYLDHPTIKGIHVQKILG